MQATSDSLRLPNTAVSIRELANRKFWFDLMCEDADLHNKRDPVDLGEARTEIRMKA